jgi:hypothetical protein
MCHKFKKKNGGKKSNNLTHFDTFISKTKITFVMEHFRMKNERSEDKLLRDC